ncbi:hypothetical protein SporoP37_12395 [Sporosarcina sp. P37]|uniref:serine hydrolase domain-containing protein n=1 Tax=unclassified Sporosarcina TaxID=2647733 RepID=UPI000A17E35B|nr:MULTISPECIES: serine hydrolase domain-containing protein [unclassified Sporosarcina]ARK25376.1 hypothetical protein SporoP37_12395 [Sporosarcina sp. P37]
MKHLTSCIHLLLITCAACIIFPSSIYALNTQSLEREIDQLITEHQDDSAGLAVQVVQDGEAVIRKSAGYGDLEKQRAVDDASVFEWGSVSKVLVWISVMQLAEEELLELEQDIEHYLPNSFEFPKPIQLQHLMNHTAGFDDTFTDLMLPAPAEIPSLAQALENADVRQVFQPGEVAAYSNYGAALAAYIVERVSGQDYREYVHNHIFRPLGMEHTSIDPLQRDHQWVKEQRLKIKGYTAENERMAPDFYAIPLYPAGSVIGTANDLGLLAAALLSEDGHPLFKQAETIHQLFQPTDYYPGTDIPRMANGLFALPASSEVYGHGGNTAAFSSSMYLDQKKGIGVLVLTNQANESNFTLGIPDLLFGKPEHHTEGQGLEDPSVWKGVYEPARMPHHGFSKIYGVLNRISVTTSGSKDLKTNGVVYAQRSPGVYISDGELGIYSRDMYSKHPVHGNILSAYNGDLLQVPMWRHVLDWCLIGIGLISVLYSVILLGIAGFRKTMRRAAILLPNVLNVLLAAAVSGMFYQALSFTAYDSLKVFMAFSLVYVMMAGSFCAAWLAVRWTFHFTKGQMVYFIFTVLSCVSLCVNVMYWEFYR